MGKTTIAISKDLRDTIKIRAIQEKTTIPLYIERLVMRDMGLENVSR